ncbi:DUF3618 domain-containing protein [Microvirga sp. 2MCAF38]|uniref:DUF3618 domain-containing protein n=1 Tax=Microvirga sp. 2MCAF38 TaxID=3232989 RepID=UPI003F9EA19F
MTRALDDLERDIEVSRAKLDQTIDRLQRRMTVSGVVDDALGVMRAGRYVSLFDTTLVAVRRNPIPVFLVAAGIGLFMQRMRKEAREDCSLPMQKKEKPTQAERKSPLPQPPDLRAGPYDF